MKTVKTILIISLLFTGITISASAQNTDAKMVHSKEINKSADEVWKILRQMEDIDKYSSNIAKVDWSGNKGIGGQGTVFVVTGDKENAIVTERIVRLGERVDGNVEILGGLRPGERFVSRSSSALKDNQSVKLSILSN